MAGKWGAALGGGLVCSQAAPSPRPTCYVIKTRTNHLGKPPSSFPMTTDFFKCKWRQTECLEHSPAKFLMAGADVPTA